MFGDHERSPLLQLRGTGNGALDSAGCAASIKTLRAAPTSFLVLLGLALVAPSTATTTGVFCGLIMPCARQSTTYA